MSALGGRVLPVSPQQVVATKKKRNTLLCRPCREDKKGCTPQNRNWALGEKCQRCKDSGHECGPPEKAQRKKRRATIHTGACASSSTSTSPNDAASMQLLTSCVSAPTLGDPKLRPITVWGAEEDSISPQSAALSSTQPDPESTVISPRKLNEQEACRILAKLGDLDATRKILLFDLKICDQVDRWTGCEAWIKRIRNEINAAIAAICDSFKTHYELAESFTTKTKDVGPEFKKTLTAQLRFLNLRFIVTSDEARVLMEKFDNGDLQEGLHEVLKNKARSVADYLFGNTFGRTSSRLAAHAHMVDDLMSCYLKASESIEIVFSDIMQVMDPSHRQILLNGFGRAISALPPCHLAVSQMNASVLLALWEQSKQSRMSSWDKDYLRRTPVHSAMYAGMVQGLHLIWQTDRETITDTGYDSFGLTPLAIAACQDDEKTFIKLAQAGAVLQGTDLNICDGTGAKISILGLAARNGSEKVVRYILSRSDPMFFQTESSELCVALLNNQIHIANILIDGHCEPFNMYDLSTQIAAAEQIAKEQGFQDISIKLRNSIWVPTRYDAAQSLDNMGFDAYINYNAYGGSNSL